MDTIQSDIYKKMTPAQKMQILLQMRELAWNIKSSALREKHPDWSAEQIHKAVRDIFLYATT